MGEHDAIEALERLGLSEYEANVFIGLQKLSVGTARDVARITDVPRSQVYGTTESLEDRGLIDIQQSNPIQYRPVPIDEARAQLRDRFEREAERAFDFIEDARTETPNQQDPEAVWTVAGQETIDTRIAHLVRDAEAEVLLGLKREDLLTEEIETALRGAVDEGVDVTLISRNPAIRDRFEADDIAVLEPRIREGPDGRSGRILVVDETVLLSVLSAEERSETRRETAIWSTGTNFASVLGQLVEGFLEPDRPTRDGR